MLHVHNGRKSTLGGVNIIVIIVVIGVQLLCTTSSSSLVIETFVTKESDYSINKNVADCYDNNNNENNSRNNIRTNSFQSKIGHMERRKYSNKRNNNNSNNNNTNRKRTLNNNSEDDDNNTATSEHVWETNTYEATVLSERNENLLSVPIIRFVLIVQQQQDNNVQSQIQNNSNDSSEVAPTIDIGFVNGQQHRHFDRNLYADTGVPEDVVTKETHIMETFYKTSVSFRKYCKTRNETIWRGYLQTPTATILISSNDSSIITDENDYNNNNSNTPSASTSSTSTIFNNNNRIGFATVYERNGYIRSATFTTETTVYDLLYLFHSQTYEIRSTLWNDFPAEEIHDHTNDNKNTKNGGVKDVTTTGTIDNSINKEQQQQQHHHRREYNLPKASTTPTNDAKQLSTSPEGLYKSFIPNISVPWITYQNDINGHHRLVQSITNTPVTTIDLLIVVTNRGLCQYIGLYNNDTVKSCPLTPTNIAPMDARIQIIISDTNNALSSINVQIRLLRVIYYNETSTYDPIANGAGLNSVIANTEISTLRNTIGADLVAVIAGSGGNCGIQGGGWPSITNYACLVQYSMSHEIGHCFRCNHNREMYYGTNSTQHLYAHGFFQPNSYRTFLSGQNVSYPRTPRIPYFSSSTVQLPNGQILGTSTADNLRQIYEYAPIVSKFKTVPTLKPTKNPTFRPTRQPTKRPTSRPTLKPSGKPTSRPTRQPSGKPTSRPTPKPTSRPTLKPTSRPSIKPTSRPTRPTFQPSRVPTSHPVSSSPTQQPTKVPTTLPIQPSSRPTPIPIQPSSSSSTKTPKYIPTISPLKPMLAPSSIPKQLLPSSIPTSKPSVKPFVYISCTNKRHTCTNQSGQLLNRVRLMTTMFGSRRCLERCIRENQILLYFAIGYRCGTCSKSKK